MDSNGPPPSRHHGRHDPPPSVIIRRTNILGGERVAPVAAIPSNNNSSSTPSLSLPPPSTGTSPSTPIPPSTASTPSISNKRPYSSTSPDTSNSTHIHLPGIDVHVPDADKDYLEIIPLGSGNEVGRSCHIIRFKGKTIMLDCGIHPAYTGISALPFFDEIDIKEVDLLLISHFHLDHAAALPYLLEKTEFRGRVFMTHPTKSIYKLILQDFVKVSTISIEDTLYDEKDLLNSMDKIEVINYHQVIHHAGIKFWCYNAGHVLGAAMFMIEIAGIKILYTGDYSRREDRHLMSAETPEVKPDILMIESTYGVQTLEPVQIRERRFTELVHGIVARRGRCLIPVFALGRAQELLLILDEYWEQHPELRGIPIYYASALAKKCMTVYQTYINMMNKRIQVQSQVSNPFIFKHITNLKGMEYFDDSSPCVVMASPGMLQNGLSRELFELWCSDSRNGVVIPGYCVEGTLAKTILNEPTHITTLAGQKVPMKCSVNYVSFSAHADYSETSEFIDILKPPYVILVHGDATEMGRLKQSLLRKHLGTNIRISTPKNCQSVMLEFKAQKIAKTVGKLAQDEPEDGAMLSGLVVRKDFAYHIMATEDLSNYTSLASTIVRQRISVPFHQTLTTLRTFVSQLYDLTEHEDEMNKRRLARREERAKQQAQVKEAAEKIKREQESKQKAEMEEAEMNKKEEKEEQEDEKEEDKEQENEEELESIENEDGTKVENVTTIEEETTEKKKEETEQTPPNPDADYPCLRIHDAVTIYQVSSSHVDLEWQSNPVNDMIADSLVALILSIESNPGAAKIIHGTVPTPSLTQPLTADMIINSSGGGNGVDDIVWFLQQQYNDVRITSDRKIQVKQFQQVAIIDPVTLKVDSSDPKLISRLHRTLLRIDSALQPLRRFIQEENEREEEDEDEKTETTITNEEITQEIETATATSTATSTSTSTTQPKREPDPPSTNADSSMT